MQQKCHKSSPKNSKKAAKMLQKMRPKMQQKCRTIANSSKTTTVIYTGWAGEAVYSSFPGAVFDFRQNTAVRFGRARMRVDKTVAQYLLSCFLRITPVSVACYKGNTKEFTQ